VQQTIGRRLCYGLANSANCSHGRRRRLQYIIYRTEIAAAADPEAKRAELIVAYEDKFNNPYFAASLGAIEEIIAPRDTRKKIVALLDALKDKKETRVSKKHNNIPL
jgi:propionyl-CoA carboxylase beta chain